MSAIGGGSIPKSPLDAAQKIVAELQGMTPEHQSLALKFTLETLGLQLPNSPMNVTPPAVPVQTGMVIAPSGGGHSKDVKSFTASKAPKSDQQFVAVVAYFYQFEAPPDQRKEFIDVETIKNAARLAGWEHPPQWRFTLQNAKNAGYLDSVDGGYKLSSVGENLVAINLPGNAGAIVRSGGAKKKTKKNNPAQKTSSNGSR